MVQLTKSLYHHSGTSRKFQERYAWTNHPVLLICLSEKITRDIAFAGTFAFVNLPAKTQKIKMFDSGLDKQISILCRGHVGTVLVCSFWCHSTVSNTFFRKKRFAGPGQGVKNPRKTRACRCILGQPSAPNSDPATSSSSMELISGLLLIYFQFPAKLQMNILSEVVLIAHTLSEVGAFIQVLCPWGACLINNRNEVVACLAAVA